jgi:hypothetical protein
MTGKDPGYVAVKIYSPVLLSDLRTNCLSRFFNVVRIVHFEYENV